MAENKNWLFVTGSVNLEIVERKDVIRWFCRLPKSHKDRSRIPNSSHLTYSLFPRCSKLTQFLTKVGGVTVWLLSGLLHVIPSSSLCCYLGHWHREGSSHSPILTRLGAAHHSLEWWPWTLTSPCVYLVPPLVSGAVPLAPSIGPLLSVTQPTRNNQSLSPLKNI